MNVYWLTTSATSVLLSFLLTRALCTWTTRYQLACLAHTVSLQSPWRNSVLLLTLLQESTQHASHMNNQILSLRSNTLEPSAPSLFHFRVQFAPSINNSTSDKMEENDWACFPFMVGRQSVQLKVETVFFFLFPFVFGLINVLFVCECMYVCVRVCFE